MSLGRVKGNNIERPVLYSRMLHQRDGMKLGIFPVSRLLGGIGEPRVKEFCRIGNHTTTTLRQSNCVSCPRCAYLDGHPRGNSKLNISFFYRPVTRQDRVSALREEPAVVVANNNDSRQD